MELPDLPSRTVRWTVVAAFFLAAFAVYGASLYNGFVQWDDGLLIYRNPAVVDMSFASVWRAFTTYDPELYIPLTLLSYQVDYLVGQGSPWPFHAQNLLWHTLNALMVSWIALLLLKNRFVAVCAGLLFLLHPLHTEAVAWASARKDVLATAGMLGSLLFYLYYRSKGRRLFYTLSILLFLLGLMAKVVVVTLPVLLVLLLWRDQGRITRRDLLQIVPHLLLSVLFGIIAVFGKTEVAAASSWLEKILLAARSTVFYIGKLLWPTDLSVLYPVDGPVAFTSFPYAFSIAVIVLITVISLFLLRRTREAFIWWAWYVVTLSPTFINIAKGDEGDLYIASDRYAYIPSIGFFFCVIWILREVLERPSSVRARMQTWQWTAGSVVIVLCIFGYLSSVQLLVWRNTQALFEHAIAHATAPSYMAYTNVGNAYRLAGDEDRALESFEQSIAIKPHPRTYVNLGAVQRQRALYDQALVSYDKALALDPEFTFAYFGIGIVHAAKGETDAAFEWYNKALALDPNSAEIYTNIGALHMQLHQADAAIEAYQKAIAIDPLFAGSWYNLGIALAETGKYEEAIAAYEETVSLSRRFIPARINLGLLYAGLGRTEDAVAQFRAILRIDPDNKAATSALRQLGALEE